VFMRLDKRSTPAFEIIGSISATEDIENTGLMIRFYHLPLIRRPHHNAQVLTSFRWNSTSLSHYINIRTLFCLLLSCLPSRKDIVSVKLENIIYLTLDRFRRAPHHSHGIGIVSGNHLII
jgi:hypothetical protein